MLRRLFALLLLMQAAPTLAQDPLTLARKVADWQLAQIGKPMTGPHAEESSNPRAWIQAAFWIGMTDLAERPGGARFRQAIIARGRANAWQPGERLLHADDHAISQAYLWAARNGAGLSAVRPTRTQFEKILRSPPRVSLAFYSPPGRAPECFARWCWCDALFMSPPAWLELARQTGDARYRDYALAETFATVDFLYDPAERLFYRDSRFFERRDEKGRKMFWSRGNGWVFAGLARMIPRVPAGDPRRKRLEALFKEMASRLIKLQKPDGYWSPSLLGPEGSPPESSGTGFFTHGLAWGVNTGLLDRRATEPAIRRGWAALARAVASDGRLGWIQMVGDRPDQVREQDTQFYGVGAFLLAAGAVSDLDAGPARTRAQ